MNSILKISASLILLLSLGVCQRNFLQPNDTKPLGFALTNFDTSFQTTQQSLQLESTPSWKDPFNNMPRTWAGWYQREFRTERIPFYAGIGVLTTLLVIYDHEMYIPARKLYEQNYSFRKFSDYSEFMGQGWFQFGIAGAFAIHGFVADNNKSLQTASQTVEVILTCGAVIQLLKHVTGRETPILATSWSGKWVLFPNQIDYIKHVPKYDAFPTGHLATATATLTVIMDNYPEATWIPYIGYPAIACIGVAMVGQGIHWVSDYPLGIAIGYSFAKVINSRHSQERSSIRQSLLHPNASLTLLQGFTPGISLEWPL
ncbi:MAG: phosphatase PAP2 family protein [Bacteroidota bacterium]|nr:phosphatase PAP2 family protein [Bacteroidota bacterium]